MYGSNRAEMDIKVVIPAPTQKLIAKTKDQKDFPWGEITKKNAPNIGRIHEIKYRKKMDKALAYRYLQKASIESTAGNKTRLSLSPFLNCTR